MKELPVNTSRRNLLKAGLAAPLAMAGAGAAHAVPEQTTTSLTLKNAPKFGGDVLPTRAMGKTGQQVPVLAVGGASTDHSLEYLEAAWDRGVRFFDTAEFYENSTRTGRAEENLGDFFTKYPERRSEIFLTTKRMMMKDTKADKYHEPEELLTEVDRALKKCGVKQIDLVLVHAMDPSADAYGEHSLEWFRGERVQKIAQQLKDSGKVKYFGFSAHAPRKEEYLHAAAEGGWVDAILIAYNPMTDRDPESAMCKALDACHAAGIGLIAMKTIQPIAKKLPPRLPELDPLGLNTYQAILQATLGDPRICCVYSQMEGADQMDQNTQAVRTYKEPLKPELIERIRTVAMAAGPTMCPGCDGSCAHAAGTQLALSDIARYVTYFEVNGNMHARAMYQALPDARRLLEAGVDLHAAQQACPNKLDFAGILKRAECYFG